MRSVSKSFLLGTVWIDAIEYAVHGNAVLGIRGSGKTYTATSLAEQLMRQGVPIFAFDPIGVWRWLRVPDPGNAHGRGFDVVVAGGEAADLPLTIDNAAQLTDAAMEAGVSLVFDLFDMGLSKADWRRIVTAALRTMLHGNRGHGVRHVFLEEAAEFVPQRVLDGVVYAEVEKLARMGGNVALGYTLINQRSQEIAKAVLELCENVFLHRQRGRHAIEGLDKWLAASDARERNKIIKSLPDLPMGSCWAWLGGDEPKPPTLIKVQRKASFHPDRRALRPQSLLDSRIDVSAFVADMRKILEGGRTQVQAPRGPLQRRLGESVDELNDREVEAARQRRQQRQEDEVTKEEADALREENERLKRQIAELQTRVRREGGNGTTTVAAPIGDVDTLYQTIKERLSREAPTLLQVLAIENELEVRVERRTVQADGSSVKGRVARLIASGFFKAPVRQAEVGRELKRTGAEANSGDLHRRLRELQADGFLTMEADGWRAVEGMKVNILKG